MKQRELDLDRTARETKVETLRHQQAHFQEQLQIVQTDMQTILDQLSAAEQQTEELKSDLETRSEALFEKKNHLGKLQSQAALLLGRQKTVANELVALVSQSDQLILTTEERDDSLKQTQTTMAALELEKQRILESLEQIKATRGELQDQMNTWRQSLQNDQYRLQTLTELERRREGYSDTARRLMAKASQDPAFGRGITGILGELITVEPGLELALETALGPALSHLVTDTEATAGRLIAFLKQNRAGRATFLPVATIHGHRLEGTLLAQIQTMPGFVGLACDLVSARADLKAILESLLGRIVIARHLDAATQMARQIHYACRFVTLDGDVVNPGGSLTGGFNQKATSNVLGRGREIENLQQQIAATQTKCEELTAQLHDNEQMLQDLTHQLETCEQEWLQLSHQKVREEAQMEALAVQSHQLQLRNQHLSAEQDTLLLQQDQLKRQIAETQREIQAEEMALQAVRQQISRQDGASKRDQLRRDELREELSDLKVSLHSIDESLRSAQEIIDRINQEREALIRQQNQSQKEAAALEAEILERTSQCQDLDKKIRQLHEDSLGLAEQVRQLNRRRENLEASQSRFFDSLEAQTTRISQLQTEIGKADGKIERLEQSADEARNRLWESYELTVQTAGNWRQQIASRTEAGKQVAALKSAIRSLGPVNLASIDEYQAVRERLDFMAHQRDDIVAAQNQLQRVIAELTAAMQRQFSEQFQLINENFKVVFAELFGGGMAEVLLENPDDVLNQRD
jgi:chromosome segregation protein